MIRFLTGLALAIGLCVSIAAQAQTAPPDSPVARHGALSVANGKVVDQSGKPVTLRGMSLFWSQWEPEYYSRASVDWLVDDWKISVIRVATAAEGDDSARQHFDRELAKASVVIDAAIARGIYVIVDWHAHHAYPADAERFLIAIAQRYGNTPNVIYETWNEPLREGVNWSRDVRPYHMKVVSAIRAIDPDNLIIAGSPSWSQDVEIAALDPLPYTNLAYTLHFYAGTHKQDLRDKAQKALDAGLALFVTEYGTVDASGNGEIALAETQAWWAWMEERGISYAAWSIADKDESSASLRPGTPPSGWSASQLTPSGALIRDRIRSGNSK
jgi:endoglucanase